MLFSTANIRQSIVFKILLALLTSFILWVNLSILYTIIVKLEPLYSQPETLFSFPNIFDIIFKLLPFLVLLCSSIIFFVQNKSKAIITFTVVLSLFLSMSLYTFDNRSSIIERYKTSEPTVSTKDTTAIISSSIDTTGYAVFTPTAQPIIQTTSIDYELVNFVSSYVFKIFRFLLKFQLLASIAFVSPFVLIEALRFSKKSERKSIS